MASSAGTGPPFPCSSTTASGRKSDFFERHAMLPTGIDRDDFAKQMTMIAHAGYETIDLETLRRFRAGRVVELPPRPLLLTFDDARADSWTGADVSCGARFRRGHVRGRGEGRGRRRRVPTWGGNRSSLQGSGRWQPAAPLGRRSPADPLRPRSPTTSARTTPMRSRARTSTSGGNGCGRTSTGAGRRSPTTSTRLRAARVRSPVRGLRPGGTQQPSNPGRPARLADRALSTPSSPRTSMHGRVPGVGQPLGRIQVTRATTGSDLYEQLLAGTA